MTQSQDRVTFEIDYAHEKHGWIDCFLTVDGERHALLASDVYPPFEDLQNLLNDVCIGLAESHFVWDEEGRFKSFRVVETPDVKRMRLRIANMIGGELENAADDVWLNEVFTRRAMVSIFYPALRTFMDNSPTAEDWGMSHWQMEQLSRFLQQSEISERDDGT